MNTKSMTESVAIQFEDGKVVLDMFDNGRPVVVVTLTYDFVSDSFIAKIHNPEKWMPPFSMVILTGRGEWLGYLGISWS